MHAHGASRDVLSVGTVNSMLTTATANACTVGCSTRRVKKCHQQPDIHLQRSLLVGFSYSPHGVYF